MFDGNMPVKVVRALRAVVDILDPGVQVEYMPHFMNAYEMRDDVWLPKLSNDQWVVVSADRAKRSGGKKLPAICEAFGLTHVLLGPSIHALPQMMKLAAVLSVWNPLIEAAEGPAGLRDRMVKSHSVIRFERA